MNTYRVTLIQPWVDEVFVEAPNEIAALDYADVLLSWDPTVGINFEPCRAEAHEAFEVDASQDDLEHSTHRWSDYSNRSET